MIHTTIGIYPDGSYKVNGVKSEDLDSHIAYNQKYRPGRALLVDGKIILPGMVNPLILQKTIRENNLLGRAQTTPTLPYQ